MKVGYVPEHFSTPIVFAKEKGFFKGLDIELIPYPSGSGHLIQSLQDGSLDVAIGLTEAFIRGIATGNESYSVVGTYVESPLRWAVSTGFNRADIVKTEQLAGGTIGVSRMGSGSHVMAFVLALEKQFKKPYFKEFKIEGTFKNLRESVNNGTSDAFMWEYFTTKKYYDNKEVKQIGEIYTPWPSWVVNFRNGAVTGEQGEAFLSGLQQGVKYFNENKHEAVSWIFGNLDYSEEDANEWIKTVKFSNDIKGVDKTVVSKCCEVLLEAGVLSDEQAGSTASSQYIQLK